MKFKHGGWMLLLVIFKYVLTAARTISGVNSDSDEL